MQRFRDSAPHAEQRRTVEKPRRSFMGKKGLIAGIVVASAGAILWLNKYAPFWRVNLCSMSGSGSVACSGDPDPNLRSKLGEFYLILNRTNSNVLKLVTEANQYTSFEEAEEYISSQETGNYRIVSNNPMVSCVPLEELDDYELVHASEQGLQLTSGNLTPQVKIFQYIK